MGQVFSERVFNVAVAVAALLIMALPVGLATIYLGFIKGESPCTLCAYERFGMVVVAVLALLILRYGPHRKYIFTLGMAAFFFLYTTFWHWSIDSMTERMQGFCEAMFGAHTYTWGVFVFWVVIAAAAIGLLWIGYDPKLRSEFGARELVIKPLNSLSMISGVIVFVLICLNSLQFLLLNGPPPFTGTGQPPRFTLDVGKASQNWTLGIWNRVRVPTLHRITPPMVHVPGVHSVEDLSMGDPGSAPLPTDGTIEILGQTELGFDAVGPFDGRAGGIAYDQETGVFGIVSTGGGVYFVEDDFSTVQSSAIIDTVNGYNISITTDAMFVGPEQLAGMAWNKTIYGAERVGHGEFDEFLQWKEYRETTGDLAPLFGSKNNLPLQTVRGTAAYTLSAAMDHDSGLYSVVTVPSPQVPEIVITQFGPDNLLARENVLTSATDAELDLSGYYPVGAEIVDGTMYLLSKTYQSLLVIDMEDVTVTATYELPELGDYHGIAAADGSLFILSDLDGTDTVFEVTMP